MNVYIPERPEVVIFYDGVDLKIATNIAPNLMVRCCDSEDEYYKRIDGMPYNSEKETSETLC